MKKILGISLVAVLAATPLMARAERNVAVANYATPTSTEAVASTSYVQGAYKASSDRIDALVTDTNVAENGNYIDANTSVAHNLGELDTAVKANTDAIGDTTYAGGSLSAAVATLQTSIGDGANALGGRVTTLEGNTSFTSEEVAGNAYLTSQTDIAGNVVNVAEAVETLNGSGEGSVAYAVSQEASARETADSALSGRITTLEQHDSALAGTYATKTGVDNTIKAVTLTTTGEQSLTGGLSTTGGSFDIATSWTDASAVTTKNFLTGATANYALAGATTVEINDTSVSYATANNEQ